MIKMKNNNKRSRQTLTKREKKSKRKRIFLWSFIVIVAVLVIIRIALPIVALRVINNKLDSLPNYTCIVKGFSVSLMDKSITLKGVEMKKRKGKIDIPFFTSGDIYVHLESYKERTSKVVVDSCKLNLVRAENKERSQLSIDKELIEILKNMPLKLNILIVKNAEVHFIEKFRSPDIDLSVKNISIDGRNFENQNKSTAKYPSTIQINGDFEGGKLKVKADFNKQKKNPMIHVVSSFSPIQVSRINNFLKVYAKLNVDSGTLSATSIINIKDGRLDGFIDPIAKNLVFHQSPKKSEVKFFKRLKQAALNVASKLLGKGESEKIQTIIELHGPLSEVKVNVWDIILEGLKKSFTPEPDAD